MTEETRERIRELVDAAPPLSQNQRHRLAELLHPVRRPAAEGAVTR